MKRFIDIKNIRHGLLGTVCLMVASFACRGCMDDYRAPYNEPGMTTEDSTYVTLTLTTDKLSVPESRAIAATGTSSEIFIQEVMVFAFRKASGDPDTANELVYQAEATDPSGGRHTGVYTTQVKLLKSGEDNEEYSLMVICNWGTTIGYSYYGMSKAELQQELLAKGDDGIGRWPAKMDDPYDGYTPIHMYGETAFQVITDQSFASGNNNIFMTRSLARFDVGLMFQKGSGEGDDLKTENFAGIAGYSLDSIFVYRVREQAAVIPAYDDEGQPIFPSSVVLRHPGVIGSGDRGFGYKADEFGTVETTLRSASVREIYVPENRSDVALEATAIVVGIYDEVKGQTGYYRMLLDLDGDDTMEPVIRNNRYIFSITSITGDGMNTPEDALNAVESEITYTVIDWNQMNTDLWMSGDYYFKVDKRSVTLPPQAGNDITLTYTTNLQANNIKWEWTTATETTFTESSATSPEGITTGVLTFHSSDNNTGVLMEDVLHFTAGDLTGDIAVTQRFLRMDYTIDCDSIVINGKYMIGTLPDPNENSIDLIVENIDPDMIGMEWVISTEAADETKGDHNVRFSGRGVFTQVGTQQVTLYADTVFNAGGTAQAMTAGLFNLKLVCNNAAFNGVPLPTPCPITFGVGFQRKKLLTGGLDYTRLQYSYGGQTAKPSYAENGASYYYLRSEKNFSLTDDGAFPVAGFNITDGSGTAILDYEKTAKFMVNNGDIAILGGIWWEDKDVTEIVRNYVDQGGVLIVFHDSETCTSTALTQMAKMFDDVDYTETAPQKVTFTKSGPAAGARFTIRNDLPADDPIVSGWLGGRQYNPSIANLAWGVHRVAGVRMTIKPEFEDDFVVYSYDGSYPYVGSYPLIVRSKKKNIIWVTTSGFIANYGNNRSANAGASAAGGTGADDICPFAIDEGDKPMVRTGWPNRSATYAGGNPVYNSFIFRNIMAWAIYQAEFHGINSNGLTYEGAGI
jgi:hypothetical protein